MNNLSKTYVIGIAGGSASGKTTFPKMLEEALRPLRVKVFHMDTYFKPEELRSKASAPVNGKIYMDDNHPLTVDLPRLEGDLERKIIAGENNVIIVEGLLTFRMIVEWVKNSFKMETIRMKENLITL